MLKQGAEFADRARTIEALIARRTARGYRADESRALLADLIRSHRGDNLAQALVYEAFATERQAYAAVRLI